MRKTAIIFLVVVLTGCAANNVTTLTNDDGTSRRVESLITDGRYTSALAEILAATEGAATDDDITLVKVQLGVLAGATDWPGWIEEFGGEYRKTNRRARFFCALQYAVFGTGSNSIEAGQLKRLADGRSEKAAVYAGFFRFVLTGSRVDLVEALSQWHALPNSIGKGEVGFVRAMISRDYGGLDPFEIDQKTLHRLDRSPGNTPDVKPGSSPVDDVIGIN